MTHDELVNLIANGIPQTGGTWADFGAGRGNFTRALRDLVGTHATIYAIDRDQRALFGQGDDIHTITADFTQPIDLPPLDGLLVANALHFIRDQRKVIQQLAGYLRPGGVFLLVEYDVRLPRGYIPFPLPYARFEHLATALGWQAIERVGARQSPSSGTVMYAAKGDTFP